MSNRMLSWPTILGPPRLTLVFVWPITCRPVRKHVPWLVRCLSPSTLSYVALPQKPVPTVTVPPPPCPPPPPFKNPSPLCRTTLRVAVRESLDNLKKLTTVMFERNGAHVRNDMSGGWNWIHRSPLGPFWLGIQVVLAGRSPVSRQIGRWWVHATLSRKRSTTHRGRKKQRMGP